MSPRRWCVRSWSSAATGRPRAAMATAGPRQEPSRTVATAGPRQQTRTADGRSSWCSGAGPPGSVVLLGPEHNLVPRRDRGPAPPALALGRGTLGALVGGSGRGRLLVRPAGVAGVVEVDGGAPPAWTLGLSGRFRGRRCGVGRGRIGGPGRARVQPVRGGGLFPRGRALELGGRLCRGPLVPRALEPGALDPRFPGRGPFGRGRRGDRLVPTLDLGGRRALDGIEVGG